MAAGVKHYLKDGTEYKGKIHKTSGMAMTGAKHTKASKDLFHKKRHRRCCNEDVVTEPEG